MRPFWQRISGFNWNADRRGWKPLARAVARAYVWLRPGNPRAWGVLASTLIKSGTPEEAEAAIRKGIARHPDFALVRIELVGFLINHRRLDEAAEQLEHVAHRYPEDVGTPFQKAKLALARRDWEAVATHVEDAIGRLNDSDIHTRLLMNLGIMLLKTPSQRTRAEAVLHDAARRTKRGDPEAHMIVALLDERVNPDAAAESCETALLMWAGSRATFNRELERIRTDLQDHGIIPWPDGTEG